MTRVWLRDDVLPAGLVEDESTHHVDQDPEFTEVSVLPVVTVKVRTQAGYDWEGNQEFEWVVIVEDEMAVVWTAHDELDDLGARTTVHARCVVLYDGDRTVTETSVVVVEPGGTFRVESVAQTPDRLEMQLLQVVG